VWTWPQSTLITVPCQDFEVIPDAVLADIVHRLKRSHRPVLLLGGGISRSTMAQIEHRLIAVGVPVMLTWNAMDRLPACHPMYCGRPNTWGQRAANILIQQADFVLALGTRLGLQQTGFNWQEFVPIGKVVQVDCDIRELQKGHPRVDLAVCGDANQVLKHIANQDGYGNYSEWVAFCREVNDLLPLDDPQNKTAPGYVSPYQFCLQLSQLATSEDVIIPCSSGNANTVMQETFLVKRGQRVFNNGGLASMGYGLSGAIGAAVAARGRRTLLVEGDGGFIQNLQELGTVAVNRLRMKIFLFDNNGYASIRMTQASYFGGHYVGCDTATGLGMPNWDHLFAAYSIPLMRIGAGFERDPSFLNAFESTGPAAFMVPIDPEQTYYPKITSQIAAGGGMVSNPLHRMSPDLSPELAARVFRYLSA
jgi:acetolactate synthase-1/2/3 large subunit